MIEERQAWSLNGWFGVLIDAAVHRGGVVARSSTGTAQASRSCPGVVAVVIVASLVIVPPGQTSVVQFFGRYVGTVRRSGLTWVLPLTIRRTGQRAGPELRDQPPEGQRRRRQPGRDRRDRRLAGRRHRERRLAVDDYLDFVSCRPSRRSGTSPPRHPYDDPADDGTSLRGSTDIVADELAHEVAQRVAIAGVEIVEVRISHLAYAPEIAQAMLRRQQANAVVAARSRIVDGAVGMVELALDRLTSTASSSWTRSARRRWSATSWSCSAAISLPRRSSTPARSIRKQGANKSCCG